MTEHPSNPRSILHAIKPFGLGTPQTESLLSYLCRLAVSHSVSTLTLSRQIVKHIQHEVSPNFDWHERQISGIRESALTWSAALSKLTSVPRLDRLTFLTWREVISQNGLSIVTRGQFCPACLAGDHEQGREPYFHLAWESAEVTVCTRHRCPLIRHCPHCMKDNIRHAAAFVVPGWCTHCGEFLGGQVSPLSDTQCDPWTLWRSRQIGDLLAAQTSLSAPPKRDDLMHAISHLITEMDNGQAAAFARRVGIAKSTIHHWLKDDGTPTLNASLKIAERTGASLTQLLTCNLSDWHIPSPEINVVMGLFPPTTRPRAVQRELDWLNIERQLEAYLLLPIPISVLEAARRLRVEARQLYLHANCITRQLGQRWKSYLQSRQEAHVVKAWPFLEQACVDIWKAGKAVTRREVTARVPTEILNSVANLEGLLKDVQAHLKMPEHL